MTFINHLFEPQNMNVGFEVWALILMVVFFTTYFLKVVTDIATALLACMLLTGAYLGNVAGRAFELVAATTSVTAEVVIDSTYACFAGMFAMMTIWFLCNLILPGLIKPRVLTRSIEPKAVVGQHY